MRVLIADDQALTRRSLVALFSTCQGVEVVGEASDGVEAVRLCEEHRPDVALVDACMPVLDGIDATRRIKRLDPGIGVVVLTMYGGLEADAMHAGADEFLVKGGPPEELQAAILRVAERVCDRSATEGAGGTA